MERLIPISFFDLADSREFSEFFEIVRDLMGIQVALVDSTGKYAKKLYPPQAENGICRLVQAKSAGAEGCHQTDLLNCAQAARSRQGIQYLCHAGLVDMAVPIFVDGRHIATINCGQVLPEPPTEASFHRFQENIAHLNIPTIMLRRAYFASPYLSPEKLEKFLRLFAFFAEYCCEVGRRLREASRSSERREISLAKRFLKQHFRETVSLEETAQYVNLSPAYFSTLFKKVTGLTHTDFLQQLRVDEAKHQLGSTQLGVTEIALGLGFNSLTHFNRVFKKIAGCSPSQYRREV